VTIEHQIGRSPSVCLTNQTQRGRRLYPGEERTPVNAWD